MRYRWIDCGQVFEVILFHTFDARDSTAPQEDTVRSWPLTPVIFCCRNALALNCIRKRGLQHLICSLEFWGESGYGFATNMWPSCRVTGKGRRCCQAGIESYWFQKIPFANDLQGLNSLEQNVVSRSCVSDTCHRSTCLSDAMQVPKYLQIWRRYRSF